MTPTRWISALLALVLAMAASSAYAVLGASLYFLTVPTIAPGQAVRLHIDLYEFAGPPGVPVTGGAFTLVYPVGVVNTAAPNFSASGCSAATVVAPGGGGSLALTGITIPYNSVCALEIDITSNTVGVYPVTILPGAFTAPSGSAPLTPQVALLAVPPPLAVNSLADAGVGSLRQVINDANEFCAYGPTIRFDIAGIIAPTSALPPFTCEGTVLDGSTAPGYVANTAGNGTFNGTLPVHLDFSDCVGCDGLYFISYGEVRGLAIYSYSTFGILVDDSLNIHGNVIGLKPGTSTSRGATYGVHVRNPGFASIGNDEFVGDSNLITGNQVGVYVEGGANVHRNLIGGDESGSPAVANSAAGLKFDFGGSGFVGSNFVRHNGGPGILLTSNAERVIIFNNAAYANTGSGIDLDGDGPTPNDETAVPYDQDGGPNDLFNYPVVTSVIHAGADTIVQGYVKTHAFAFVDFELYHNSTPSTPTRTQGEKPVGYGSVQADETGYGTFSVTIAGFLADNVSAAGSLCGDGCDASSEYSPTVAASAAAPGTVVTNPSDNGLLGSLRYAINYVNANCSGQAITFAIPGPGVQRIQPLTSLPDLACDGMVIDGYSQPGAGANTLAVGSDANILIEIDGTDVSDSGGLRIAAPRVKIKGLSIHSFSASSAVTVVAPTGTIGAEVLGNFIGIDAIGARRSNMNGITNNLGATGLAIGGGSPWERNVISGNTENGIYLQSGDLTSIQNNYIGLNPAGTGAIPNNQTGISLSNTTNTRILGNVISGNVNTEAGLGIMNDRSNGTIIDRNLIGTNAAGTAAIASYWGITVESSNTVQIGAPGAGNVIAGMSFRGVRVLRSSDIRLNGNKLGTDITGSSSLPSGGDGVEVFSSDRVEIGGRSPGEGNIIANHSGTGVSITSGQNNPILGNFIYGNTGAPIVLGSGLVANDACDVDTGPNDLQNFPVLTSAGSDASSTTIVGTATGRANATLRIEFFALSAGTERLALPRVKSAGPGMRYLGTVEVNAGPACGVPFSLTVPLLDPSDTVTATATDVASSNTGPFAVEVPVTGPPPPPLSCSIMVFNNGTGDGGAVAPGDTIVTPGGDVGLAPSCTDFTGATFLWSNSATDSFITVTGPAAGGSATYSVTVTTTSGTTTASRTLRGAVAAAPLCTIVPNLNNPVPPGFASPFDMVATCAPGAGAFNWQTLGFSVLAGQGTPRATYQFDFTPSPGYGYTIVMTPGNDGGQGPDATRIIWVQPITLSAASLAFPDTTAGTASAPLSITVTNVSDYYQAHGNATITGPFTFTTTCPEPLTAGASCTMDVRFEPVVAGSEQNGVLTLSTGFPGNSDLQIFLSGNATPGAGVIDFHPQTLTFPPRTILTTSSPQTVTFSNDGTAPFTFVSASTTGDFAVTHDCNSTLPPGASCVLDVTFTPLTTGARTGQLSIVTDLAGSPHIVGLSGMGLAAPAASAALIPGTVEFSPQLLGTQSAVQFATVLNDGTAPLEFGSIAASGDFVLVLDFTSTVGPCGGTLAPGAQCEIGAAFKPTAAGVREGAITIDTNAPEPVTTLRLVGTGLAVLPPRMLNVPSSLQFDAQRVGTRSAGRPLTITNNFPTIASITELTVSGDFSVSDTCTTIPARGSCAPLVTFLPRAVGQRFGTLTIRALSEPLPYVVQLRGVGEANPLPALEASITQASFGNAFVGAATNPVSFQLRNVGQVPVVISGIAPRGDFVASHACTTIAAGDSCPVTIYFAPHAIGRLTGSLFVSSNAEASPLRIDLSGVGCSIPSLSRARFGGVLCGP